MSSPVTQSNARMSVERRPHRAGHAPSAAVGGKSVPSPADRSRGSLLGLAVGDAVGTSVGFRPRGSFLPVTDMVGGGSFRLAPGQWTDETSMALCLAVSLIERGGFDPRDQMERYLRWYSEGYLSSTGACFDISNTVAAALSRFVESRDPFSGSTDPRAAENGSIMRLAPLVLYYSPDVETVERYAGESSRTTHAAADCVDACRLLSRILHRALQGEDKDEVLLGDVRSFRGSADIETLARGGYRARTYEEIEGSDNVVRSLEAALWCFDRSDNFEDAVLLAVNLGQSADTTAAVCGQIAGAFYGSAGIPDRWLRRLAWRGRITRLADRLFRD